MVSTTTAYGYEVVLEVEWSPRRPAMDDDTKEEIARALHESLEDPDAVDDLKIEPGYVHVRVEPDDESVTPGGVLSDVKQSRAIYNERRDDDRHVLEFSAEYVGTYVPGGALTFEEFAGRYADETDTDEPIVCLERDNPSVDVDGRALEFVYAIPIDPETYESVHNGPPPFEWDEFARGRLEDTFDNSTRWPRGQIDVLEVWPGYIRVIHRTSAIGRLPTRNARKARNAISQAFAHRPLRETDGRQYRQPALTLERAVYAGAITSDARAEAFVARHGLDEIDAEPEPEPELAPEDDSDNGGVWQRINPFGGA